MLHPLLYIMVEGPDDKRFFERIVEPQIGRHFRSVSIVQYSGWPPKKRKQFLNAVQAMPANYLYVADNDGSPCVSVKKKKLLSIVDNLNLNLIAIVIEEIESWYLAGVNENDSKILGLSLPGNTDKVNKEKFRSLRPKRFETDVEFMLELLNLFSMDAARKKNKSFDYFYRKYLAQGDQAW